MCEPSRRLALRPADIVNMEFSSELSLTFGKEKVGGNWAGLDRYQRSRHSYCVGQTGSGKTTLLKSLAVQDMLNNLGVAVIDPHGDCARELSDSIPPHRIGDTIYFDTSDSEYPIAYNPLYNVPERFRSLVVASIVTCLKSQWADSWGPRMEYILRHCLSALICQPPEQHVTLLSISRMLTEPTYRQRILKNLKDPVLNRYWAYEFDKIPEREYAMVVAPILNKLGAYAQHREIRNIIGQAKSGFCLSQIMDKGKILIVNLSKPVLGDDGCSLLGALLMAGLQQAAYRRHEQPEAMRVPFGVFVDEFHTITAPSVIASIFSEARKYALSLHVFHQYTDQIAGDVLQSVLGNVGTLAVFSVGGADAERLAPAFYEIIPTLLTESRRGEFLYLTRKQGELQSPIHVEGLHFDWSCGSLDAVRRYTRATAGRNRKRCDVEACIGAWYEGPRSFKLHRPGPGLQDRNKKASRKQSAKPFPAPGDLFRPTAPSSQR